MADEQVVAANVDVALLVASMNADFNARRLERYLATAWQSGAAPVVVLTKADLADDPDAAIEEAESVAFGAPVLAVSAVTGEGLEALAAHLKPARDGGAGRLVGRRQVEPGQCAGRRRADGDRRDPRGRRARAATPRPTAS